MSNSVTDNSIDKLIEEKRNLEMIDILISQYIPNQSKFVKAKIKKEQTNNL